MGSLHTQGFQCKGDHPETAPQEADEHREHVGSDAVMKTFQAKPNAYLASLIFFRGSASPAAPGSLRDCYPRGVWPGRAVSWTPPAFGGCLIRPTFQSLGTGRVGDASSWSITLPNFISSYPPSGLLFVPITLGREKHFFKVLKEPSDQLFPSLKNIPTAFLKSRS